MEIQQSKCWEGSTYFSNGKTGFTSKHFMLLTVTDLLTYCQGMLVTHWEFSSHVTLWKSSLELVKLPHILPQSEVTPINVSKVGKSFLHHEMKGSAEKLSNNSTKCSISKEQLQGGPLTKQDILETYSDVFTGIGKLPGLPYKFQLKPNAKPARHAPRKVPTHLQEAFHEEIRNLEVLGILKETKDVTAWVNHFVIMEKKLPIDSSNSYSPGHTVTKKLRICLDPRDLNEVLEREPYYTHSIEEIIGKFQGMTKFTIADFNKGYWMVELDPELRKYTTMALDIGRFQWTRLPMGSIVAQDVFRRKLDGIFLSIPGVTGIADDMIIYGRNDQEHDKHLLNFLEVCRKNNLTLNPERMQFRLPQVSFFGHQWSARGLSPNPKKIDAVKRMEQ